ncbi:MAG: helix-turn-helix domain-containing protein [Albidovulum sp.]
MNQPQSQTIPTLGPLMRARRRQKSITLQDLSARSGVSVGYLSQLERDNATPTLGTLAQIAKALGVGVDYFVATPRPADALTVAERRMRFSIDGSSLAYERIGAEFPGSEMSSFIIHVPAGYRSETMSHAGEEIVYVLEGNVVQVLEGEEFRMSPGDSLHYRGNRPHGWYNDSDAPAKLLWTGTLELFHGLRVPSGSLEPEDKLRR